MVEFTDFELLTISEWAMDEADRAVSGAAAGKAVNVFRYETARGIFDKAQTEYCNRKKEG